MICFCFSPFFLLFLLILLFRVFTTAMLRRSPSYGPQVCVSMDTPEIIARSTVSLSHWVLVLWFLSGGFLYMEL